MIIRNLTEAVVVDKESYLSKLLYSLSNKEKFKNIPQTSRQKLKLINIIVKYIKQEKTAKTTAKRIG